VKVSVTVKANAKQDRVEAIAGGGFRIQVKVPPIEGRANEAVVRLLAEHFHVPKSHVAIIGGVSSKRKLVKIGAG